VRAESGEMCELLHTSNHRYFDGNNKGALYPCALGLPSAPDHLLFWDLLWGPTGKNEIAGMDPHLPELLALAMLAAFGCGLALAEGHFLFVGIFAAASAVMIIEAIRRSR
jgi:hypothetical protein